MRYLIVLFVFLGLLGLIGWTVSPNHIWFGRDHPLKPANPEPVVECPEKVEVGEQEIYSLAVGRFRVENSGGKELVLSDVRTGCSCTGLEIERDGKFFRSNEIRVPVGGGIDLAIRRSVHGPVGVEIVTPVYFRTNDPTTPERTVKLIVPKVTGGVETSPRSVVIGNVALGSKISHIVEVIDEAMNPRAVERVVSSNTSRIRVRDLPAVSPESRGKMVARLEVSVDTQSAGSIEERIEIYLTGRPFPTVVPISGTVLAPVELSPKSLVLPRQSEGKAVYTAKCLCRSSQGKVTEIRTDSCPPDINLDFGKDNAQVRFITITWNHAHTNANDPSVRIVRLKAVVGGAEHDLELKIYCQTSRAS